MMDVKTGEILADASLVNTKTTAGVWGRSLRGARTWALAAFNRPYNNLPFSQAYEPGSVFKVVTFSAALQNGLIPRAPCFLFRTPSWLVDACSTMPRITASSTYRRLRCWPQSSNIGTYEIGRLVGERGILALVERLGFGQRTAINFPGETSGLLVNTSNWYASDQVALPIGQVDAVPAMQVLDAYNAIANGGVFVEPKLVRGYVYPDGAGESYAEEHNAYRSLSRRRRDHGSKCFSRLVL